VIPRLKCRWWPRWAIPRPQPKPLPLTPSAPTAVWVVVLNHAAGSSPQSKRRRRGGPTACRSGGVKRDRGHPSSLGQVCIKGQRLGKTLDRSPPAENLSTPTPGSASSRSAGRTALDLTLAQIQNRPRARQRIPIPTIALYGSAAVSSGKTITLPRSSSKERSELPIFAMPFSAVA